MTFSNRTRKCVGTLAALVACSAIIVPTTSAMIPDRDHGPTVDTESTLSHQLPTYSVGATLSDLVQSYEWHAPGVGALFVAPAVKSPTTIVARFEGLPAGHVALPSAVVSRPAPADNCLRGQPSGPGRQPALRGGQPAGPGGQRPSPGPESPGGAAGVLERRAEDGARRARAADRAAARGRARIRLDGCRHRHRHRRNRRTDARRGPAVRPPPRHPGRNLISPRDRRDGGRASGPALLVMGPQVSSAPSGRHDGEARAFQQLFRSLPAARETLRRTKDRPRRERAKGGTTMKRARRIRRRFVRGVALGLTVAAVAVPAAQAYDYHQPFGSDRTFAPAAAGPATTPGPLSHLARGPGFQLPAGAGVQSNESDCGLGRGRCRHRDRRRVRAPGGRPTLDAQASERRARPGLTTDQSTLRRAGPVPARLLCNPFSASRLSPRTRATTCTASCSRGEQDPRAEPRRARAASPAALRARRQVAPCRDPPGASDPTGRGR